MSIRQAIKDALKQGPMTLRTLSHSTGYPIESIRNARNYLLADSVIRQVGNSGAQDNVMYELTPIKAPPTQINRLTLPAYVPPKVLHRPIVDAPGCVVRRLLTNEVLA